MLHVRVAHATRGGDTLSNATRKAHKLADGALARFKRACDDLGAAVELHLHAKAEHLDLVDQHTAAAIQASNDADTAHAASVEASTAQAKIGEIIGAPK